MSWQALRLPRRPVRAWRETEALLRAHQDPHAEYPYLTGAQWVDRSRGRGRHRAYREVSLEEGEEMPDPRAARGGEETPAPDTPSPAETAWGQIEPLLQQAGVTLEERVALVLLTGAETPVGLVARALGESEAGVRRLAARARRKMRQRAAASQ